MTPLKDIHPRTYSLGRKGNLQNRRKYVQMLRNLYPEDIKNTHNSTMKKQNNLI